MWVNGNVSSVIAYDYFMVVPLLLLPSLFSSHNTLMISMTLWLLCSFTQSNRFNLSSSIFPSTRGTKAIYPSLFFLFLSEEISKVLISAHWTTIKRMFSSFLLCFLWVHLYYCCWMLGQPVGWWWWCENKTKAFELVFWVPMHVRLFLSWDWEMETFHFESTKLYRIVGSMECCLRQNRRRKSSLLEVLRFLRSVESVEFWKLLLLSGM